MADLKYNGEWLIPLQDGYRVEYPAGGTIRPPAVSVSASYRLTDQAMIDWWWSLYEANRGTRWTAMLDTAGYQATHRCIMLSAPQFQEFKGHTAVVTIRWQCFASAPVTVGYITSWPYPISISDDMTGSALSLGGKEWPSVFEASAGGAMIISGVISEPIKYATMETDYCVGGASIISGFIRGTLVPYDLRTFDTERVTGGASITAGAIDTVVVPYDLRTFDREATQGGAAIIGGTIS